MLEKRNEKWEGEESEEHELDFDELERFVGFLRLTVHIATVCFEQIPLLNITL